MKYLIALAIMLFSSITFACTDFTGEYQTEELTYYSISQNGCESMDVIDESGSNQMIFDNVERLLFQFDLEIEGQVLAHVEVYLKSKMVGNKWVYTERDVTTYKSGEVETITKWAEVSFDKNTDLHTVLHNQDGTVEEYTDIRNKLH